MIALKFREFLPGYVGEEFDNLVAQLRGFFSISFNEDGTLQGLDLGLTSVPIGAISQYAGATAPSGWLFCAGDAVSRVTYKSLFEVIGTTYGSGDGSTTFNLPDLRERFAYGKATAGVLGATGGAAGHAHSISASGDHTHSIDDHAHSISGENDHTHTGTTDATGDTAQISSGAVTIIPVAAHTHAFATDGAGSHSHGGATGTTSISANANGDHSHGGATGSATALPPYVTLNYIILAGA